MSKRARSGKVENKFESAVNGQIVMNLGHDTTTEKSKVDFICGAVPSRSKHDILLVLQSCDYNVETAISIFSQGQEEEVFKQWTHQGKKSKDGNKKKRNKKKQNNKDVKESSQTKTSSVAQSTDETNSTPDQTSQALPAPALSLNLPSEIPSSSPVENGISSPDNSTTSSPENLNKKPPSRSSHHSSSHSKHAGKHNMTSKPETKLSPTSHHADALKKTTKDLTRSSFSLARYQVLLEEECEQSFKKLSKTFENIRKCVNEREEFLTKALKEFKEQGDKLLQQRSEDAAALRLKTDRVQTMPDEQVVLLRADIKGFVAERKIDEELAQTKRFVCDEEKLIQELKTFGQVVPIKGTYTPVVLNHHIPSSVSKPMTSVAPGKQSSTSLPSSSTSKPTASTIKSSTKEISNPPTTNVSSDIKSSSHHPSSSLDKQTPKQPPASNKLPSQTVDNKSEKPSQSSSIKHTNETIPQGATHIPSLPQRHKDNETQSKKQTKSATSKTTSKQPSTANATSQKQTEGQGASSGNKHVESQAKVSATSITNGPPPKISTLISMALAKSSGEAVSNTANLQEVVPHTRSSEHKRGNQPKGQNRNQQNRPNTSPSAQGKQQRNRETRPRRPQSSRQQREDKENEGRQNKADVGKEQNNPKQERQAEQSQDGRRKRQRRRGRDRKPKDNESDVVVGENAKAEPNPKKIEVSVQQEDIVKTSGAANPKTDSNPTQPEVTSPADRKEENVSVNTDNSSDSVETESSTQEVSIKKENEDSNTKNDSSMKEINGTPNHKDEDKVEGNACKEEDQETNQNSDVVGESEEITALPQRSPRSQGRRRNRVADENKESSSAHDLNGSTNGLNHNNSSSDAETDKTEKSLVENCEKKEDSVSSKPTQVAAPSLINGHEKWLESEPIQLKINQEKELENQLEIDGQQAPNGNGEECLVER